MKMEESVTWSIHENIRKRRTDIGKKQQEVADELGILRETYSSIERGKRPLYGEEVPKLAKALGVSCDCILRGVETNNIDIQKELGLSNLSIEHLRYAKEKFGSDNPFEYLLSHNCYSLIYDLITYMSLDFSIPYRAVTGSISSFDNIDDVFKNDIRLIGFMSTDKPGSLSVIPIDKSVYENAFLERYMNDIRKAKQSGDWQLNPIDEEKQVVFFSKESDFNE